MNYSNTVFFLPVETRPSNYFSLPKDWKYWHVGIIHDNFVYELFSNGRHNKEKITNKRLEILKDQKAVFFYNVNINESKLLSEFISRTSCATYVARVLDLDDSKGPIITISPDGLFEKLNQKETSH